MSRETKFGYGFLLLGIAVPFLIEKFFGEKLALVAAALFFVTGVCLLIAGHLHERRGLSVKVILTVLLILSGVFAYKYWVSGSAGSADDQAGRIEHLLEPVSNAEYRRLVAGVIGSFEPNSSISVGALERSPDGRRTVDVELRSEINRKPTLTAIDIVDLPAGQKAGISAVDAAESKKLAIKADKMLLCSDTGFDEDAIRKAKRTRIGLISILRHGDSRVRAVIEEETYLRKIRLESLTITYSAPSRTDWHHSLYEVTYRGGSVDAWLQVKAALIASLNPELTKGISDDFRFKKPTYFDTKHGPVLLKSVAISFVPSVQWLSQTVTIDAKTGIYDYVRGHIRLTPGDNSYIITGIDFDRATPLTAPPPFEDVGFGLVPGEMEFALASVVGASPPSGVTVADIDDLVLPEDLNLRIPPAVLKRFSRLDHLTPGAPSSRPSLGR